MGDMKQEARTTAQGTTLVEVTSIEVAEDLVVRALVKQAQDRHAETLEQLKDL
jgi:hypothetical protein